VAWLITLLAALVLRGPVTELANLYGTDVTITFLDEIDTFWLFAFAGSLGWIGAALSVHQNMRRA
jgi:cell division protein FtsX